MGRLEALAAGVALVAPAPAQEWWCLHQLRRVRALLLEWHRSEPQWRRTFTRDCWAFELASWPGVRIGRCQIALVRHSVTT
mmetsp:Transcript_9293/g.19948  ORF Transcript_9293/g.19948 Transcript_9293/m.19948 type:complete len:81 (+) Transcript_9293:178-420(+)